MRRQTWSTPWIGMGVGVATALGLFVGPAAGQIPTPPYLKWTAKEHLATGASADDQAVDIALWTEDLTGDNDAHWVYATGWVTEMDGNTVVGTRFATYKYDAEANGTSGDLDPTITAYFPPRGEGGVDISQGDTYKAVAMAVDVDGNVYVAGEGPHTPGTANDQDYFVVMYNKNLVAQWTGNNGARTYDGPGGGNDIPTDVVVDSSGQVVVVTGTSPGDGTGLDIATVGWYTVGNDAGELVEDLWPADNDQPVAGVRRYDNIQDDDTAAELGPVIVAEDQGAIVGLYVIVLGTTWNGATPLNDFTTHGWYTGGGEDTAGTLWDRKFNLGGDDIATGIVGVPEHAYLYCAGYSYIPADGPEDYINYSIVAYVDAGAQTSQRWYDNWDYHGGPDYCFDVASREFSDGTHIWLTGEGRYGTRRDVATAHYIDTGNSHSRDFATGFNVGGSTTFNYGNAVTICPTVPQGGNHGLPYITGSYGGSTWQSILTLKYRDASPFSLHWYRTYAGSELNEGRGIVTGEVELPTYSNISFYIAGVSSSTADGREFTIQRYRE